MHLFCESVKPHVDLVIAISVGSSIGVVRDGLEMLSSSATLLKYWKEQNMNAKTKLKSLRSRIDTIDQKLLNLLRKRLALTEKVAVCKLSLNLPIYQKKRWVEMLHWRRKWAKSHGISEFFAQKFFHLIHLESLTRQKKYKQTQKITEELK